jgi:hypothetical protein
MFAFQKRNIRNIKGDFKRSAVPQRLLLQGLQPLLHHQELQPLLHHQGLLPLLHHLGLQPLHHQGHQPLHLQELQLLFQERQPILPLQGSPS